MPVLVVIPARLGATRLPRKPLADIGGRPMVVRTAEKARAADVGRVVVATDSSEIRAAVEAAGFEAVMTREDHPSGSDRVFEALNLVDPDGAFDTLLNLQGDFPTISPETVKRALAPLSGKGCDIATLGAEIHDEAEKTNPNVVKVVGSPIGERRLRALYFTRATAPWGEGPLFHHVGVYAFHRAALGRFVSLPPSVLETREKLEQLRALEAGMRIDVGIVDEVPVGVDGPAELELARRAFA
ncbi:3-deoxy-manno-octulosonate cytidylyltransferase [Jeongeupella avenae]|uniref:3-deoxy-manno-octulosonate cytidylyltransferase n=2 Tax=Antarcticirhabdus aurantiaca TaxID=2606717 RepID=A0ACD4NTV0_9HYPH|nr:3-deoxy-manno-octulosonate cytidylyltransferase [Antarcticirhabdus aurantiaca]WAJ30148.1 3-deoxy-manno-octulosonate cytidylyltransferase [Jeongeuplla avenae]